MSLQTCHSLHSLQNPSAWLPRFLWTRYPVNLLLSWLDCKQKSTHYHRLILSLCHPLSNPPPHIITEPPSHSPSNSSPPPTHSWLHCKQAVHSSLSQTHPLTYYQTHHSHTHSTSHRSPTHTLIQPATAHPLTCSPIHSHTLTYSLNQPPIYRSRN